jgi:hypothetical protein
MILRFPFPGVCDRAEHPLPILGRRGIIDEVISTSCSRDWHPISVDGSWFRSATCVSEAHCSATQS